MQRAARWIGWGLVGIGLLGIFGSEIGVRAATETHRIRIDPRKTMDLDEGRYGLRWVGPVHSTQMPCAEDITVEVITTDGTATIDGGRGCSTSGAGSSHMQTSLGTLVVNEGGHFRLAFATEPPVAGRPQLTLEKWVDEPPLRRPQQVTILGAGFVAGGAVLIGSSGRVGPRQRGG